MCMVGKPVVFKLSRMRVKAEHDPARTATETRTDPPELRFRNIEAAKRFGKHITFGSPRDSVPAQVVEIKLVKNNRPRPQQLFALQLIVDEGRRVIVGQRFHNMFLDDTQGPERAALVILPVPTNQAL